MFRHFLKLSLLSSFGLIVYQRLHIQQLTHEISSFSCGKTRAKRSLSIGNEEGPEEEEEEGKDRSSVYFPVYAQISKKAMRKLCAEHERDRKKKAGKRNKKKRMNDKPEEEIVEKPEEMKKAERKKCSQSAVFSSPRLISRRSHWNGCALREGNTWFVCEYYMGYMMLEYADANSLTASLPRAFQTLPFSYDSTDGAAINGSVAYAHDDQLVLHNFKTLQTNKLSIELEPRALYNGSFSRMDIESDEHGLWILYVQKGKDTLTVTRVSLQKLKVLQSWDLPIRPSDFCNAFIRCGILHSISCDSQAAAIQPIYDFYSAQSIVGKKTYIPGVKEEVNSAQYDPVSQTVSIFSRGLIYSISIEESNEITA